MAENTNPEAGTVAKEKDKAEDQDTMSGKAKKISGLLSILSFVLSLPILASVIWLLYMKNYDCENLLRLPKLQLGIEITLIIVFLISNAALFLRSRSPMPALLVVMVPLIVMLIMGLALVGAYNMEDRKIPASPMWFKLKVHDDNNWNNIKSCIYDTGACNDYVRRSLAVKSYDFNMRKLNLLEAGCCTPPKICQMEYVNATFWSKANGAVDKSYPNDSDCDSWKNDRDILCYDCQSCRDGFLKTLESKWWKLGLFLVLMALFLIFSHLSLFIFTMWERYVA
ncbi:Tetraspannin domain-containing protein [Cephalotus follicularis]|uniref:Tetraspannin domain-containing protein n=1 Tax=Cephalotus follicularis TaxID=3775 RepID=A0A1Q3CIU6_CEPFO|nr:Tetraspannin domain-containing protein [Cephalotus follicularis]